MSSGASTSESFSRALATLRKALGVVRAWLAGLSRPAKILCASTAIAAVVLGSYFAYKASDTTWSTLFANLDREDAAAVVAKLKEMKVPYRLGEDGSTISVPDERARDLRLELASAGLPRGGGVGFESFDKMRLGATEFEQRVQFRRALEGELARTIDTLSSVQSARVHLVLPERSVFVGRSEPSSASVVLKLRPGRVLGASEVTGIVHLVASSVAGLAPDRVTVVSSDGAVLHKPRNEGDVGPDDESSAGGAGHLEASLEERTRRMLEKVVGAGHVEVRVRAEIDRARVERVEDRYAPKGTLRNEQHTVEHTGNVALSAAGVPGADSPPASSVDGGAPELATREASTRNYEIDHVSEKRVVLGGEIKRLTVAVVVDGPPGARSREELDRLGALVRGAVGADDRRGDIVTVDSVPFLAVEAVADATSASGGSSPSWIERRRRYVPFAAAGVGILVVLGVVVLARRARRRPLELAESTAITLARPEVPAPAEEVLRGDALREAARARAAEDPATAALVLRFWLGVDAEGIEARPKIDPGTPVA
jgi:flagellar M-ring protein FliF